MKRFVVLLAASAVIATAAGAPASGAPTHDPASVAKPKPKKCKRGYKRVRGKCRKQRETTIRSGAFVQDDIELRVGKPGAPWSFHIDRVPEGCPPDMRVVTDAAGQSMPPFSDRSVGSKLDGAMTWNRPGPDGTHDYMTVEIEGAFTRADTFTGELTFSVKRAGTSGVIASCGDAPVHVKLVNG